MEMKEEAKKQQQQVKAWLMEHSSTLPGLNSDCAYPIKNAFSIINKHFYRSKCKVKWVKKQCNIHRNNFSAHFARVVGYTPKEYILHLRIEAGKQLLCDSVFENVSIGIISFELGFYSPPAFSRYFKDCTGLAPAEWRKEEKDAA